MRRFARLLGVVPSAVVKARHRGVFSVDSIGLDMKGRPIVRNVERAIAEWEASGRQLRVRRASESAPSATVESEPPSRRMDLTLVEVTRATMLERQRRLRIANDLAEGKTVLARAAHDEAFTFSRELRENILNLPPRLGGLLAAESSESRCYSILDAALREALTRTADVLAEHEAGLPAVEEVAR